MPMELNGLYWQAKELAKVLKWDLAKLGRFLQSNPKVQKFGISYLIPDEVAQDMILLYGNKPEGKLVCLGVAADICGVGNPTMEVAAQAGFPNYKNENGNPTFLESDLVALKQVFSEYQEAQGVRRKIADEDMPGLVKKAMKIIEQNKAEGAS